MLKNLYQVIFNHFVRKEGYHGSTEVLSAVLVGLIIFFYIFSICSAMLLILNSNFLRSLSLSKGYAFIFPIIYFIIIYIILFYVLKLTRHGSEINKFLFIVDKKVVSLVWTYVIVGLALFGTSIVVVLKYLKQ